MIKRYLAHVNAKSTHHRRQHAAQMAGIFTAIAFIVWVTTLGYRFSTNSNIANSVGIPNSNAGQTQLAGVGAADDSTNGTNDSGLQVVGTTSNSVYSSY